MDLVAFEPRFRSLMRRGQGGILIAVAKHCKFGGKTKTNGNCETPDEQGRPVQCVGRWARDKHDYLRRYIEATRAVRAQFLVPGDSHPAGGAAFIDLFAGPGRARIGDSGEFVDGSPLIALAHQASPFTKLILCELDDENVEALRARTVDHVNRVTILDGDCNQNIDAIIHEIPTYGLNLALIDPYGLQPMRFDTIAALARVERMDLIIHFPTADIKRNLDKPERVDRFLGGTSWRDAVRGPGDVVNLIETLKRSLVDFGYSDETVRSLPVKNRTNSVLYHLVFAAKNDRGNRIWQSIAKTTSRGQLSWGGQGWDP